LSFSFLLLLISLQDGALGQEFIECSGIRTGLEVFGQVAASFGNVLFFDGLKECVSGIRHSCREPVDDANRHYEHDSKADNDLQQGFHGLLR